ncbi:MAG TPA: hypothetical protein VJ252_06340, partial [Chthoniobacterales bacterium]|nr:hypothetical protein [Chthoniobacterales bacterium]
FRIVEGVNMQVELDPIFPVRRFLSQIHEIRLEQNSVLSSPGFLYLLLLLENVELDSEEAEEEEKRKRLLAFLLS